MRLAARLPLAGARYHVGACPACAAGLDRPAADEFMKTATANGMSSRPRQASVGKRAFVPAIGVGNIYTRIMMNVPIGCQTIDSTVKFPIGMTFAYLK